MILMLENLLINHISKNLYFTDSQLDKIIDHVHKNPKVLTSSDYLKINRCVSYMTFLLKEVYDYCTSKCDEVYLNSLRRAKHDINRLKLISEYYNKAISS